MAVFSKAMIFDVDYKLFVSWGRGLGHCFMVWFLVYLVYFLSPGQIRIGGGGCKAISLASVRLSFHPSVDESVLNTL